MRDHLTPMANHLRNRKFRDTVLVPLLLALLMSTSCASAVNFSQSFPNAFFTIPSLAVNGDDIVVLADGKLYEKTKANFTLAGEYPNAKLIAFTDLGVVLYENGEHANALVILDDSGSIVSKVTLENGFRVKHMVASGSKVALIAESKMHDEINHLLPHVGKPYLYEIPNDNLVSLPFERVLDISIDEDDRLYILHESSDENRWVVSRFDLGTKAIEELLRLNPMEAIEFCATRTGIYILSSRFIVEFISFADGERQTILEPAMLHANAIRDLQYENQVLYGLKTDPSEKMMLFSFDVSKAKTSSQRTLTIINLNQGDERTNYMGKWFAEHYPDVQIKYSTVDETMLITKLMSGDLDIDIVFGQDSLIGSYAKTGAFLSIDEMPLIEQEMKQSGFLPISPAMSYAQKQYVVPSFVIFYTFKLNEPLMSMLELEWPSSPYSWTDLANWAIPALQGSDYTLYSELIGSDPPGQYVDYYSQRDGIVKLDTSEFRTSMDAYRRLYQANLVNRSFDVDESRTLAQQMPMTNEHAVALPTIDGQAANVAEVIGFYINKNTNNRDLVEAYLSKYVTAECQQNASFGEPGSILLRDASSYNRGLFELGVQAGESDFSEENEQLRIASFDNLVVKQRNVYLTAALGYSKEMQAYLDGEIEIDEYIRLIQPKLDMVQYE